MLVPISRQKRRVSKSCVGSKPRNLGIANMRSSLDGLLNRMVTSHFDSQ
jgi:hypothetical protein